MKYSLPLALVSVVSSGVASASTEIYSKHAPEIVFGFDAPHLHLLTNHIPIFVTFSGLLVLVIALYKRDHLSRQISLLLLVLGSSGAVLTHWLGQQSYKAVRGLSDEAGQDWLDLHMERSEQVVWLFWIASVAAGAALIWSWRSRRFGLQAAILAGLLGASTLGASSWIADAGGKIRHSEFRRGEPSAADEEDHHSH